MPSNRTPENLFCESPRNALELLLLSQGAAIAIMTPRSDPLAVVGLIDGLFDLSAPRYSSCFDLQRPRFLTFDRAAELWREGALDGLVLQVNDQLKLGQLPEIELSPRFNAVKDYDTGTKYIFVTRRSGSAPVAP